MQPLKSWVSPKTQRKLPSKIAGNGFFAIESIQKGEILAIKIGHIVDHRTIVDNAGVVNDSQEQIADNLWLAPLTVEEEQATMIYVNHSCEPNGGWQGQIVFVAVRDIAAGEEITADYATHSDDDLYDFDCNCQTPSCRKHITGKDWQIPALQKKYDGYFAWFLEQKIKKQKQNG